jgi:hypothetical protein
VKRSTIMRRTPMVRTAFQPKATGFKRSAPKRRGDSGAPTAAEKRYMGRVAALGCAVCRRLELGETPAIVHHQRTGQGWGRAPHYYTVPLCPPHHQFSGFGLHDMGREQFAAMYGISETELVLETRMTLRVYLPQSEQETTNA